MVPELKIAPGGAAIFALPTLPPWVTARYRVRAWGLAFAVHLLVLAFVLWSPPARTPETPPLVRLVFVEPPPPPPPPAGAPGGTGEVAQPVALAVKRPPQPVQKQRVATLEKPPPRHAPPVPRKELPPQVVAAPAAAELQAGGAAGTVAGVAAGVAGGVSGGTVGGIVGGRGSGPLPAGQVAHPPSLVRRVTPQYPRAARQRGIEGLVVLEAILDTEGRVGEDIKILESVPALDRAAREALRQWRFKPARNEVGTSVAVILEVPIRFVLR